MSQYYNAHRTRNLYQPGETGFKLSRSKLDLFWECPRCFYIDRRLGVGRPPGFPFAINSAVDHLLKLEFDSYRAAGQPHPLQEKYGLNMIPAAHPSLDIWRENFKGLEYFHEETGLTITGAIDDLWIDENQDFIVVDYKATAGSEPVTELNKGHHSGYKRQMEIYQWLLRNMGHRVSDTGYFVYCTGQTDKQAFDAKVEFAVHLIAYEGSDDWVEELVRAAKACLESNKIPTAGPECDYCAYTTARKKYEG